MLTRAGKAPRVRLPMDLGWRFKTGDCGDAQSPDFDASAWRTVDLPHDWSIEGKIAPSNPMGAQGGFFPAGVGWYRRSFDVPQAWQNKRVTIEFEGVYMNSDVWLNGRHLGFHPYGYTAFFYDLTPYLEIGARNELAVRVDNSRHPNSRWYSGSGIYRHVWLTVTEPVHVAQWGVFVTTPEVSADKAKVVIKTRVINEGEDKATVKLQTILLDPDGRTAGETITKGNLTGGEENEFMQKIDLAQPKLWSMETPQCYRVVSRVLIGDKIADEIETPFGVRSIEFSSEGGFQLNGKTVKLCGGCIHHDLGCLGSAAFDRAEERRLELLKEAGFNAVRTAHNPPSPSFLDTCDRLGILVIDEAFDCWETAKNPHDYGESFKDWWERDIDAMVLRDRNHPSNVMWSIGNEIPGCIEESGIAIGRKLVDAVRRNDSTRPVTNAGCTSYYPDTKWCDMDGAHNLLDVCGCNYALGMGVGDHSRVPSRILVGTESFPKSTFDSWKMVNYNPYVIGDFVWTAQDYFGEAGIGYWTYEGEQKYEIGDDRLYPLHGGYCGDLDLCGFRKPISHYRNIVWDRGEKLYLAVLDPTPCGKRIGEFDAWAVYPAWPSWTWPGQEGKDMQVEVYSACDKVRLYLNDKLIGEKPTTLAEQRMAVFTVSYEPGVIKAVGLQDDRHVAESVLQTVGDATQICLIPDRAVIVADGQDLSFVVVEVLDINGRLQPNADNLIEFEISGPGIIAGVGNGDMTSEEPYQSIERRVFHGSATVVVRASKASGEINLTARCAGLADGTATINAQ